MKLRLLSKYKSLSTKTHAMLVFVSFICYSTNFFSMHPDFEYTLLDMFVGTAIPCFVGGFSVRYLLSKKIGVDEASLSFITLIWFIVVFFSAGVLVDEKKEKFKNEELQRGNYYLMTARFVSLRGGVWTLQSVYDNKFLEDATDDHWGTRLQPYKKDTVLIKKTLGGYSVVVKGGLSDEEIKRFQRPILYVNEQEQKSYSFEEYKEALRNSHKRLGCVFEKQRFGLLKVGVTNLQACYLVVDKDSDVYDDIYKTVEEGDTVILRVSDSIPSVNQVLNWHPTREEIEKCRTPVKLVE